MRILLYEWCCSGGLAGQSAEHDLEAIAREGRMMLESLCSDAARDASLAVTVLVDERRRIDVPEGVTVRRVPAGGEVDALVDAARAADWTLIVAPESDGILADRVRAVRRSGACVLGCDDAFIAIASDKQRTANALAAAGVPVPPGRPLAAGAPVPAGFSMPAVRKALAGVGCDDLTIVRTASIEPSPRPARLEAFVAGIPAGVSCLCGPSGIEVLPPMRQRFTAGDAPRYVGSDVIDNALVADRAARLARRAVAAIERAAGGAPAVGWVGVDMILGQRDDGGEDRVLEVNPRLTTSFVWLASRARSSLVRFLVDHAG